MVLEGGDIVLRQHALPDLDADLGHVVHNRDEVRVGMVDGDDAARADVAVEAAVGLLEELAPHLGLHKEGVFRAPVIVGEDDVWLQAVDQAADIVKAVLRDRLDELVHLVGMLVERGQRIFKAHEEVALLKNARAHETGEQCPLGVGGCAHLCAALLPALGADAQVGNVDGLFPAGDVCADGQLRRVKRDSAGGILGKADGRAPTVFRHAAALAVAAKEDVDGIAQAHMERLVLAELALGLAVRLDEFKKYLFRGGHGEWSSFINTAHRLCRSKCGGHSCRRGSSGRRRR